MVFCIIVCLASYDEFFVPKFMHVIYSDEGFLRHNSTEKDTLAQPTFSSKVLTDIKLFESPARVWQKIRVHCYEIILNAIIREKFFKITSVCE